MALKFLNKKGWHTGSLRNIENVWKAEQKHDAEQKKLEELRKQIHEERERSEFRLLQEQAGLVPKQERLDFLYDSGLAVGKSSSDGFKALEALPKPDDASASSSSVKPAAVPGALFEDKPQSANDAWRKLHSDPLLMIRQREQEALARIRNNPVQMAMILKSVEATKHDEDAGDRKGKKKHREKDSKKERHSSQSKQLSEKFSFEEREKRKSENHRNEKYEKYQSKGKRDSDDDYGRRKRDSDDDYGKRKRDSDDEYSRRKRDSDVEYSKRESRRGKYKQDAPSDMLDRGTMNSGSRSRTERDYEKPRHDRYSYDSKTDPDYVRKDKEKKSVLQTSYMEDSSSKPLEHKSHHRRHSTAPKLSEEERAAKLQEMQVDAELHEEQRWKRLKRADEDDAREATRTGVSRGKNFLDDVHKSVYGAEKGGSSTIEESVRRRTHYLQGRSATDGSNAFRR